MNHKQVFIETFGCQMNVADTGLITWVLEQAGYVRTENVSHASVVLLNTCAVREHAEDRVRARLAELGRLKRLRPDLVLGVTGCMPRHLGRELLEGFPHVDLLVGPDSYRRLPELIEEASRRVTVDLHLDRRENYAGLEPTAREGVRAFVPIMRGCDHFCSFCVVPLVRGRERSLPMEEVLRQVRGLVERGVREVTLLGQTVNSYHDDGHRFVHLLDAVSRLDGLLRVRFTSPHPAHFTEDQLRLIAERPNLCAQFHVPVQSGSNRVLAGMKRGYTREEFLRLVEAMRRILPEAGLSTDILVGFPGETDEDFGQTVSLMNAVQFDSAFLFRYSPRSGTYAWRHQPDDVPLAVKAERLERAIRLQEAHSLARHGRLVGHEVEVLVQGPSRRDPSRWLGRAEDGKMVVFGAGPPAGALHRVRIARATSHTLLADGLGLEGEGENPRGAEADLLAPGSSLGGRA